MGALLRALLVFLALASASTVASEEARDDRERLLCGPYKHNKLWTRKAAHTVRKASRFLKKITGLLVGQSEDNAEESVMSAEFRRAFVKADGSPITANDLKDKRHPVLLVHGFGGSRLIMTEDAYTPTGRCKTTEPLWLSDMDVADALRKKPLEINKRGPKQDALRLYWVPNDFKNLTHHARKCRTPRLRCYPGGRFQQHLTPEQEEYVKSKDIPIKQTKCDLAVVDANARCDVYRNSFLGLNGKGPKLKDVDGLNAVINLLRGGSVKKLFEALPAVGKASHYFRTMVGRLVELGYTPGRDLFAAPYDFRFAPATGEDLPADWRKKCDESYQAPNLSRCHFRKLARLIIAMADKAKRPVMVYAHSNGNHVISHLLRFGDPQLKTKLFESIAGFTAVNGPHLGSIQMLEGVAVGVPFGGGLVSAETTRHLSNGWGSQLWNFPRVQDNWLALPKMSVRDKPLLVLKFANLTRHALPYHSQKTRLDPTAREPSRWKAFRCTEIKVDAFNSDKGMIHAKCRQRSVDGKKEGFWLEVQRSVDDYCVVGFALHKRVSAHISIHSKRRSARILLKLLTSSKGFGYEDIKQCVEKAKTMTKEDFEVDFQRWNSASKNMKRMSLRILVQPLIVQLFMLGELRRKSLVKYARLPFERIAAIVDDPWLFVKFVAQNLRRSSGLDQVRDAYMTLYAYQYVSPLSILDRPCSGGNLTHRTGCVPVYGVYTRFRKTTSSALRKWVKDPPAVLDRAWRRSLTHPYDSTPSYIHLRRTVMQDSDRDQYTPAGKTMSFVTDDITLVKGDLAVPEDSGRYVCRPWSGVCMQFKSEHTGLLADKKFLLEATRLALDPGRKLFKYKEASMDPTKAHNDAYAEQDATDRTRVKHTLQRRVEIDSAIQSSKARAEAHERRVYGKLRKPARLQRHGPQRKMPRSSMKQSRSKL